MAGTILVTNNEGLATSTIEFDYLVARIKKELLTKNKSIAEEVYAPFEEGGMNFISTAGLDSNSFQIFAQAVRIAHAAASHESSFSVHENSWLELLTIIDGDARLS